MNRRSSVVSTIYVEPTTALLHVYFVDSLITTRSYVPLEGTNGARLGKLGRQSQCKQAMPT